jgi:glycosyltransferase involved in cell wall biosynthesis
MRILLFAPNYLPATRYGGPIASSHGLARALVSLGHEVHVFTTNVDGASVLDVPLATIVNVDGVQVRYFPISTPKRIYRSPAMAKVIDAEIAGFDVAHVNGVYLWPGPRLAAAAQEHGVPVVISPRGMLVPELIAGKSAAVKRLWIALKERPRLAKAAAIHVTSEEEQDGVSSLGLDLAPLVVLGNGVDPPADPPQRVEIEQVWHGVAPGSRVAFLGRLDWTKGLDLAVEAVRAHPDAYLLIAGPDQIGLRPALEPRLIRDDGSTAGRFVGAVEGSGKWALLTGADVLLAPSLKESFGMSVAEALCVGTPVICTPGVGAATIVARTDAAAVVERSPQALSSALAALLADEGRRQRASAEGRRIMAAEYTWDAIARGMADIYERASLDTRIARREKAAWA